MKKGCLDFIKHNYSIFQFNTVADFDEYKNDLIKLNDIIVEIPLVPFQYLSEKDRYFLLKNFVVQVSIKDDWIEFLNLKNYKDLIKSGGFFRVISDKENLRVPRKLKKYCYVISNIVKKANVPIVNPDLKFDLAKIHKCSCFGFKCEHNKSTALCLSKNHQCIIPYRMEDYTILLFSLIQKISQKDFFLEDCKDNYIFENKDDNTRR